MQKSRRILALAKKEGIELTDDQLEAVTGGICTSSTKCPNCGCKSFNWDGNDVVRNHKCAKCHTFVYSYYFGK